LPIENIGTQRMEILKEDLRNRILNLDPRKKYFEQYSTVIKKYLKKLPKKSDHPLTIMFTIGGAGAQKEIGLKIIKSLSQRISFREIKIIISVGKRAEVKEYFEQNIKQLRLGQSLGKNIEIIFNKEVEGYFREFNAALRKTDILWIKPSELSFFTALGLPIIIAPPIGSQEEFNRKWLLRLGSGIIQENPDYADQWLFDFLNSGIFAECAMQGFVEAEQRGVFKIEKIIFNN
jgi:UDP-N-acetylglucosamine:LPS N-acetylglucosamine transferase